MSETVPAVPVPASTEEQGQAPSVVGRIVTGLIVGLPFLALAFGVIHLWGYGVHTRDIVLLAIAYLATGHGVTIGFHRLLAHRAFVARRSLKIALVALGSMAFQGGPIAWVATHRRHHVFADKTGDPHSPRLVGTGVAGQLKGLWHSHMGWLFTDRGEPPQRRTADLHADRDLTVMNSLFPLWCAASLALPFALGWLLGGTIASALTALLWAGLVRVFLLHHITWSINSLGHMFGRRPFATRDRSTNIAVLSLISMGESWHNGHHAFPRSARHGLLRGQWDTSALLISVFGRLGWAERIHRPNAGAVQARREASHLSPPDHTASAVRRRSSSCRL